MPDITGADTEALGAALAGLDAVVSAALYLELRKAFATHREIAYQTGLLAGAKAMQITDELVERCALAMLNSHYRENGVAEQPELGAFDNQCRKDARACLEAAQIARDTSLSP